MEVGNWYNLRFELYADGLCKVYIDGSYALTLELTVAKSTLNRMEVRYWVCAPVDDGHGLIYDNIYLGADSKAYVDENNPDEGEGEGGGSSTTPTPDEGENDGDATSTPASGDCLNK